MSIESGIHPLAALLRGFAVDFLTCHNVDAVPRIMAPQYRLNIGGHVFDGRDEQYLPATAAQLAQFPGLCVTVHDVLLGENALAMRFTEHGASVRDEGRRSSWRGVTLFRTDGERLVTGWAEEDYIARKRQLTSGVLDAIEPPHPAPWDMRPELPVPGVEQAARAWLTRVRPLEDVPAPAAGSADPEAGKLIAVWRTEIDELFGAGERVAFHATHHGSYEGGFPDIPATMLGAPVVLRAAGILDLRGGVIVAARIFTDRLGLYRALRGR